MCLRCCSVLRTVSLLVLPTVWLPAGHTVRTKVCVWQNILHRDLKPANIFLTQNMDVLLGDFGMSRQLQAMATQRTTYA